MLYSASCRDDNAKNASGKMRKKLKFAGLNDIIYIRTKAELDFVQ